MLTVAFIRFILRLVLFRCFIPVFYSGVFLAKRVEETRRTCLFYKLFRCIIRPFYVYIFVKFHYALCSLCVVLFSGKNFLENFIFAALCNDPSYKENLFGRFVVIFERNILNIHSFLCGHCCALNRQKDNY